MTDSALDQFRSHYRNSGITKTDIFHYAARRHPPPPRTTVRVSLENLKRTVAAHPLCSRFSRAFVEARGRLARLHLDYEYSSRTPWNTQRGLTEPLSFKVQEK